jgi:hypothetical protein
LTMATNTTEITMTDATKIDKGQATNCMFLIKIELRSPSSKVPSPLQPN